MKIYLVRHGQSQWQVGAGRGLDLPLTALGREQSRRMGKWLAGPRMLEPKVRMEIGAICASPLRRALETAACAADALQLPSIVQPSLAEAPFRVSDHLPRYDALLAPPAHDVSSSAYVAFKRQVHAALRELTELADAHACAVLAVTHGGVIETMLRLVVGCEGVRFEPYNAALTLIEWRDRRWHLILLNFWDYLPSDLRTT